MKTYIQSVNHKINYNKFDEEILETIRITKNYNYSD